MSKQLIGNYGTALTLIGAMVGIAALLLNLLQWQIMHLGWLQFIGLLVASYLGAAIFLMGLNSFAQQAYQQYQEFNP